MKDIHILTFKPYKVDLGNKVVEINSRRERDAFLKERNWTYDHYSKETLENNKRHRDEEFRQKLKQTAKEVAKGVFR